MKCPICGSHLSTERETAGSSWFTGAYCCFRHGLLRVSGRILDDGERQAIHWVPACRSHNFSAMTQITDTRWLCMACDEEIRLIHGKLRCFRPVDLHGGRRALWAM